MLVCGREIKVSGGRVRIARLDADSYRFVDDPEAMIAGLRALKSRPDLFTFVQRVTESEPKFGYPMERENFAVIPITTFADYFSKRITSVPRNHARQAGRKGVVFRETELDEKLVRGIWEIYNETPIRQGRPYPHYGKDLETVYREESTFLDSSAFVGAYLGEELIGFIKMVWDEKREQAGLMNILSKICRRDKATNNALIAEAVRACEKHGVKNLVYDCYAFANRERDNLTQFKKSTGFERREVPRYFVPLTAWGSIAFRLGLHRRFVDRLPDAVSDKLRELRAGWYSRKTRPANASS
jgi:hypothetical protein